MFERLRQLFVAPQSAPLAPVQLTVEPIAPRVLIINHNPPVEQRGGQRLNRVFGWHDPAQLARDYSADLRTASYGYLNYQIVETIDADWHPAKIDGFCYTNETFLHAWQHKRIHEPNAIDYPAQVQAFNLIERYNAGEFDEVWFFAHPLNGDYESTMAGPGAFWCNSPPITGTSAANSRFVIMAFNYERGVDCMLENFGHRAESVMHRVYQHHPASHNMWNRFTQYDQIAPEQAQCGNVHFAPNSQRDYDWGNRRNVHSFCDDWYSYPKVPGNARLVNCTEWGNGDMRLHHIWWMRHFPHGAGETDSVANNWWQYIVDVNRVA